ncbi:kinase-like domain-containing protein [Sordaria brevicollis]|uniref:Kinase-like domain-containing protein n=1 Tax=Sordaria brevicollis TaxID=83679 RepID=A0AAE0NRD0_SORBR|nr:kinase-like domain-containing protein [Sordaria brevicollis]
MSSLAYSPNLVAVVQVTNTGARYRIELTHPPKNDNYWVIGSSSTADVNVGNVAMGIASKHIGLDINQDGAVVVKIFSAHHTLLKYESKDEYETVDNWIHECYGHDSPNAPAWVVPVNHPVHVFLGEASFSNRAIEVIIESFDHAEHLNDYLAAVQRLKSSAPLITAELNRETVSSLQPPQPSPVPSLPGTATFLSRRLEDMRLATPSRSPRNTVVPNFEETARNAGLYTHSFLQVTTRNNQRAPSSAKVVRVFCTRTGNVYAGKYFKKTEMPLLYDEANILKQLKDTQTCHVTTFVEKFLVPAGDPRRNMLITEWCDLGSIAEEASRKWFTYHECCMIIDQMAQALQHLHAQQLVHRNVRPQHILVRSRTDSRLEVCLTNFSSALKIPTIADGNGGPATIDLDASTRASFAHHDIRGENWAVHDAYIAPDGFTRAGKNFYAHVKNPEAVDIWSLGVVALEFLAGGLPFITYETEEDYQHPILVKDQHFFQLIVNYRDELARSPGAALDAGLVGLIMEMLHPSCWERITARDLAGATCILMNLLRDERMREYYRVQYPGGQFPVVMAPVVRAYDVWCGRY